MADVSGRLPDAEFIDPMADPSRANAEIAAVLEGAAAAEAPVIALPPGDLVELPGGLVVGGEVIRRVTVRELNGEAEEALAKAAQTQNFAHFLHVLIEHGTARIGDEAAKKNPELLKRMLIGDRDAIVLGIRRATYGDDVELPGWQCLKCGEQSDLTVALDDIETVTLTDPRLEGSFKVKLRKGRTATVRLVTGADQIAANEQPGRTDAEKDSVILSRCVTAITEADGMEMVTAGLGTSVALSLSLPDRKTILRELINRQPGPRYNDVKFTHESCGEEVPLSLGLGDLFPDL
jgi:hypothetical protein